MAGGQERILRRRIRSVESTKKITRAMELIAATRVVKAQERANAARPYSVQITDVVRELMRLGAGKSHPLMRSNEDANAVAHVVITSDRGLCGAYNSAVIRSTERAIVAGRPSGQEAVLVTVGKKALTYFRFRRYDIATSIEGVTDQPTYEHARAIAESVRPAFEAGEVSQVNLTYWEFLSAGTQRAVTTQLLPIQGPATAVEGDDAAHGGGHDDGHGAAPSADLEYEPSPDGLLDSLLPRYLESRIFAALLDASASEHAARQRAMKAATDNAEELIKTLKRIMNRARQDAITTEIMEIVGGAEALAQGKGSSGDLLVDHLVVSDIFRDTQMHPPHVGH